MVFVNAKAVIASFRDEERALNPVFERLGELNITPELESAASKPSSNAEVVDRVIRRAQELQAAWRSTEETADKNLFGRAAR